MAAFDPASASLGPLFPCLDEYSSPISTTTSYSDSSTFLNSFPAESCLVLERGPKYRAYADLRESTLRKRSMEALQEPPLRESTAWKQEKRQEGTAAAKERRRDAAVAQSMPVFSAASRKENQRPAAANVQRLPPAHPRVMTPPAKRCSPPAAASSQSASAAEKRRVGVTARRSYAGGAEELRGLAAAARAAMGAEGGGGGAVRNVLGQRRRRQL